MTHDDFTHDNWRYKNERYTDLDYVVTEFFPQFAARPDIVAALVQMRSARIYIEQQAQIETTKAEDQDEY